MKKLLLSLFIVAGTISAKAQYQSAEPEPLKPAFSLGPEIGFPARSVFGLAYGASFRAEIPVKNNFIATVSAGYTGLKYKRGFSSAFGDQPDAQYVPVKAGLMYKAGEGLYLLGELGSALQASNATLDKGNLFAFAVGPGFLLDLSKQQKIDIGVRYEQWSQGVVALTAIRVAYRFGL